MRHRRVLVITASAFIVPCALIALGGVRSGNLIARLADPGLLWRNWLYMAAPHLLVVLVAAAVRPARPHFLSWSLIALSVALIAFQCWVWWWVPPRESGLVWVLYIPLSAGVLALTALTSFRLQRSTLPAAPVS